MPAHDDRRSAWPWWVHVGLWGVATRRSAQAFVAIALGFAGISMIGGVFVHPRLFIGAVFLLAALWYWAALRWVDTHDHWQ
jgi:hypothetical protein